MVVILVSGYYRVNNIPQHPRVYVYRETFVRTTAELHGFKYINKVLCSDQFSFDSRFCTFLTLEYYLLSPHLSDKKEAHLVHILVQL